MLRNSIICLILLLATSLLATSSGAVDLTVGNGSSAVTVSKVTVGNGSVAQDVKVYVGNGSTADCIFGCSAGPTCSGNIANGDNESFESGEGSFCTTGLTEVDTDGVISTYSVADFYCGSHSLVISCDGDNANEPNNRVYAYAPTTSNTANVRFYTTLPALAAGQYLRFFAAGDDSNELLSGNAYLQWYNNAGTYQLSVRSSGGTTTGNFNLTPGTKYRLEIFFGTGTGVLSTLNVFTTSGTAVQSDIIDVYQSTVPSGPPAISYFVWRDYSSTGNGVTYSVDDIVIDPDGGGQIGAQTCE